MLADGGGKSRLIAALGRRAGGMLFSILVFGLGFRLAKGE
jgi:hypothetical protein